MDSQEVRKALQIILNNLGDLKISDVINKLDTEISKHRIFIPAIDESYYYIDFGGDVCVDVNKRFVNVIDSGKRDIQAHRLAIGNVYKTREAADLAKTKSIIIRNLNLIISDYNGNWIPDYNDHKTLKWIIGYCYQKSTFQPVPTKFDIPISNVVVCKSKDFLNMVIFDFKRDLEIIFDIKG